MQNVVREGDWLTVNGQPLTNFWLKLVGKCPSTGGEGRWITEIERNVSEERKRRWILLKTSDFDSWDSLWRAIHAKFSDEWTIRFDLSANDVDVGFLFGYLEEEYRQSAPGSRRIGYIAKHLGYQNIPTSNNYWYLGEELHVENNAVLPEEAFRVFQDETDLQAFSTTLKRELLDPLVMKDAMTSNSVAAEGHVRLGNIQYNLQCNFNSLPDMAFLKSTCRSLMRHAEYFGVNAESFKLALAFVASRILRANEIDEAWRDSNIAMLYSEAKNCGKSLSLRLFAHLQGVSAPHPILFSAGSVWTSRTSLKVMQATMSTTLVSLLDHPKMTPSLSKFFNRLQSGFLWESSSSGRRTPKGGILLTTNSKKFASLEGRILRFNFAGDPNHSSENESQLVDFVEGNKGLIVAWGMRLMAIWPEVAEKANAIESILKNAVQTSVPADQSRWREAMAKLLLVYTMIHATADLHPRTADVIRSLCGYQSTVSVLKRLQHSILSRIRQDDVAALTWISPSVRVTPSNAEACVPGFAILETAFESLDVSWSDVCTALGDSVNKRRRVVFARNRSATLQDLRQNTPRRTTTARANKIPRAALDQLFLDWIDHYVDDGEEPGEEYNPVQGSDASINDDDLGRLARIEEEVKALVADLFSRGPDGTTPPRQGLPDFETVTAPLTPRSKRRLEIDMDTPEKRRMLLLGFQLSQSYYDPRLRTPSGQASVAECDWMRPDSDTPESTPSRASEDLSDVHQE